MEAGKNVMTLFKSRGWTVVIADMLVDSVMQWNYSSLDKDAFAVCIGKARCREMA